MDGPDDHVLRYLSGSGSADNTLLHRGCSSGALPSEPQRQLVRGTENDRLLQTVQHFVELFMLFLCARVCAHAPDWRGVRGRSRGRCETLTIMTGKQKWQVTLSEEGRSKIFHLNAHFTASLPQQWSGVEENLRAFRELHGQVACPLAHSTAFYSPFCPLSNRGSGNTYAIGVFNMGAVHALIVPLAILLHHSSQAGRCDPLDVPQLRSRIGTQIRL